METKYMIWKRRFAFNLSRLNWFKPPIAVCIIRNTIFYNLIYSVRIKFGFSPNSCFTNTFIHARLPFHWSNHIILVPCFFGNAGLVSCFIDFLTYNLGSDQRKQISQISAHWIILLIDSRHSHSQNSLSGELVLVMLCTMEGHPILAEKF